MGDANNGNGEQVNALAFPPIQARTPALASERRDAAEHRQHILSAARVLFAEQGVDVVSMHQVALAAGVGQGTLYRRYAHKGMLCMALLEESISSFQQEMLSYLEHIGELVAALDRLKYVLVHLLAFNEHNAPLLAAITDSACGQRRTQPYHSPFYLWLRQVVMLLLQQAVTRAEIPSLDIEYAADVVLTPLAIDLYLYQRYELGFTQERIAEGLQRFLLHGLYAEHSGRRYDNEF
ncbi:MAG: TetR/AcrR family transcriptional regulator [Ktedonobacteraceae bacterium]|nr:TetR/AcrR family transcriptional regulator [Chloroflexota bacterium]